MPEREVEVREITAEASRHIRASVLRPGRPPEEVHFEDDDAPDTVHVGGFLEGRLVAVGRLSREAPPGSADPGSWRLRGMATVPEARDGGVGSAVLERLIEHARSRGAAEVWCNARIRAMPFYERAGLAAEGEEFDVPGIGPHRLMRRRLGS
ncbi:MAG: GNAT family N-acetyltransferase [Actinomycetota bacterium]